MTFGVREEDENGLIPQFYLILTAIFVGNTMPLRGTTKHENDWSIFRRIGINLKIYELKTRRDNRKEIPQIPLLHQLLVSLSPSEIM